MNMMNLLSERERLFAAIREAGATLDVDFNAKSGLSNTRRAMTSVLRDMADIRSSEVISRNGGFG